MGCCESQRRKLPSEQYIFFAHLTTKLPQLYQSYLEIATYIKNSQLFSSASPELTSAVEAYLASPDP